MAAVSEMPRADTDQADENPRLLQAQQMTGSIRWLELYRSYLLADELADKPKREHAAIIKEWATSLSMTPATLRGHIGWARRIDMRLLLDTFEGEGISEKEWTQRIGSSHLQVIAQAREQTENGEPLSAGDMVKWVIACYHGNWSVEQLKDELRAENLRAPERGIGIKPTKNLTADAVLSSIAVDLFKAGIDIDLGLLPEKWGEPVMVSHILRKLALKFDNSDHAGAVWAPKVETKTEEAQAK